jgi:mRNA deadenylase 3'-5' endonuclease subunit Ccr4
VAFTFSTYNILASAYIQPGRYPNTPPVLLEDARRISALAEHIVGLDADIVCLQEVEEKTFVAIENFLLPVGYTGRYLKKGMARPDGCATFFRQSGFVFTKAVDVFYADGTDEHNNSGHIAQITFLNNNSLVLVVANTHLKWDPPGTPRDDQYAYRQITELLKSLAVQSPEGAACIICGDFNVTVGSDVAATLAAAGLSFTHQEAIDKGTCNPNGRAKMIDYIYYNDTLQARPEPLPVVRNETPMPGPEQPSDHVAVTARFDWAPNRDT